VSCGEADATIAGGVVTRRSRAHEYEVDYARRLFEQGLPLIAWWAAKLALDLDLFSRGGLEILRAIERQNYDVLSARPAISKRVQSLTCVARCKREGAAFLASEHDPEGRRLTQAISLEEAYAACRAIAKRERRNFYYAFRACPKRAGRYLCIYAFHAHG